MTSMIRMATVRAATALVAGALAVALLPGTSSAATPARLPDPPATAGATAGDGLATVTWTVPERGAGSITGYAIEWSLDGGSSWPVDNTLTVSASARTATVPGLVNGLRYTFRVSATSAAGRGRPSALATATPTGPPGAPTGLVVDPGDGTLTLRWTAPAELVGARKVRDYLVEWSTDGTTWSSTTTVSTGATLVDLVNGTRYRVRVSARSAGGMGPAATLEGTIRPRTVPQAPTITSTIGGTTSLTVTWEPRATGGVPTRAYRIRWTGPDDVTQEQLVDGALRTATVTASAGENQINVTAINAAGFSRAARSTATVWAQDISEPLGVEVTATSRGFALTWSAPTVAAGLSGTAIAIRFVDAAGQPVGDWNRIATVAAKARTASIAAIPGSRATFQLRSQRSNGDVSAWTAATTTRMATGARPMPIGLTFTHDRETATATAAWSAVLPDTAGAPNVTGYEAEYRKPGATRWIAITGGSPASISTSGWADGTATLRVRSLLGARHSPWATATLPISTTVPGPPSAAGVTGGVGAFTVTWTPGTTGGSPLTGVKVRYRGASSPTWTAEVDLPSRDLAGRTSTISGMGVGTWEVQIAMVNANGTGTWVPAGSATTT